MAGLRERRHAQTRADIVDAAFELFAARGFAEVTMEEVARSAGVSRSTAYRRFPTKEDVVLDIPNRWLDAYDDAVADLPADLGLVDAIEIAATAVARHIDANIDRVRTAYATTPKTPTAESEMASSARVRSERSRFVIVSSAQSVPHAPSVIMS